MSLKDLLARVAPAPWSETEDREVAAGRPLRAQELQDARVRQAEAQVALVAWEWDQRVGEARARLADVEAARRRAVEEALAELEAAKLGVASVPLEAVQGTEGLRLQDPLPD